jgi:hypothetical protein
MGKRSTNADIEKCSTSLAIREMHLIPITTAIITTTNAATVGDGESTGTDRRSYTAKRNIR